MSDKKLPDIRSNTENIAEENCCVEQVINSIFDHVAEGNLDEIQNRSDHDEIVKFSNSLVENEFIFGSPSEEVLESVNRRKRSKPEKNKIS